MTYLVDNALAMLLVSSGVITPEKVERWFQFYTTGWPSAEVRGRRSRGCKTRFGSSLRLKCWTS